ncbi:Aldo/keto reductase [Flagelloscypha sp. PMI_526]|nr:Aldo/keto reductase [Flagelloscypha sp. PMI_526]
MAPIKAFTLNNGLKMPAVGIGCWMGAPGGNERAYATVLTALKHGYRHIDTAAGYQNEEAVGRAIRDSGVPREEIFLVSKLPNSAHHRVKESFEETLKELGTYLDLYLIHWPQCSVEGSWVPPNQSPTYTEVWSQMEALLEAHPDKLKSIGVSNFSETTLADLLTTAKIIPVTNQVELHPFLPKFQLNKFCQEKGIIVTAYSPLARNSDALHKHPAIASVAEAHGVTTAQVLLSWANQLGIVVIPKSENEERIKLNFQLFTLSESELESISNIHKEPGNHKSLLAYHQPDGTVFGWTYDQLGWGMKVGGVIG